METEQMLEWGMVRDRAVAHLRQCEHIDISKHRPEAQLLILPSFTDSIVVDVIRSSDELAAYITHWRQTTDIKAFATPVERLKHPTPFIPTYDSTRVDISTDQLDSVLTQLRRTRINLSPTTNSISVDGTSYELNSGRGYTGIRLRWHNQLPAEWSVLNPVVDALHGMATSTGYRAT